MNRRSFLTALALSPIAPSLLCAKENEGTIENAIVIDTALSENTIWSVWQGSECIERGEIPQDYKWHTFTFTNFDGTTNTGCY